MRPVKLYHLQKAVADQEKGWGGGKAFLQTDLYRKRVKCTEKGTASRTRNDQARRDAA